MRTRNFSQLLIIIIAFFAALLCAHCSGAVHGQQPSAQERDIVDDWKRFGDSLRKENPLLEQLTKSLQLNPPWRVVDAREVQKRSQLIDDTIKEHRRRIQILERLKANDGTLEVRQVAALQP